MTENRSFYITTPIYYVNDRPHLGHAYTTVACDVMARFKRLCGYDVKFLTGTDEHGLKVHQAAEKAGISTQDFVDKVSQNFRDLAPVMNYSNDDFIRTTEERHKISAQALWARLQENGYIYKGSYCGWYAVRDEAYYTEDELTDGPNSDTRIAPSGAECRWVEEESYFFKLSEWQDKLIEFYDAHPEFVQPNTRFNEVKSFVKGGLKDLSISRTNFDWGVPVPGDDKHVMYVWIDALTNYISALGFPDMKTQDYQSFWPADFHVVGKDILRFHAVYWPAFLMAADLSPPKCVFAHGWWTIEGEKMSKSLGNVLSPHDLVETYGLDQLRYFILREVPFGNDGDFSHEQALQRINADLANGLGNLVQRTLSMIYKNCDAAVPEPGAFTKEDETLLASVQSDLMGAITPLMNHMKFHKMLEEIWRCVSDANGYIDEQAPWTLRKEDPERMKTVLYVLAETIRCLGIIVQPFMPDSAAKILDQIAISNDKRSFEMLSIDYALKAGTFIKKPEGVFPRIETI